MTVIALLKSNEEMKSIVSAQECVVVNSGAQGLFVTFTFPELRKVVKVLQIEVETDPETMAHLELPQDKSYVSNTVGMTLTCNPTAGTTLCFDCTVVGF